MSAAGRVAPLFDPFAELAALGYGPRLIPIVPPGAPLSEESSLHRRLRAGEDARGKAPGFRKPNGLWRGMDWLAHPTIPEDYPRWLAMGAGCGVRCGGGLVAIDADTLDPTLAAIIQSEVEKTLGRTGPVRIGRPPKALYLAHCEDQIIPYQRLLFGDGGPQGDRVEILTAGKQFVAGGVHPGTMRPYRWERPLARIEDLPPIDAPALAALMERLRAALPKSGRIEVRGIGDGEVDQNALRGPWEEVRALAERLPNRDASFPAREDYLAVGYAIKAACGPEREGEGLEAWLAWCGKWDRPGAENNADIVRSDWRRMRGPFRRGVDWLRRMVERETGASLAAEKWFEPVADDEGAVDDPLFPPDPTMDAAPHSAPRAEPYSFRALCDIPRRRWLYGGHYRRRTMSCTLAPTKVGKSSLTIVEALAMASGKSLLGEAASDEGPVRVWLWNGEDDIDEMERRIGAAMKHYGLTREDIGDRLLVNSGVEEPMRIAVVENRRLRVLAPVERGLIAEIQARGVACMIVDPNVTTHEADENDNSMIGQIAQAWVRVAVAGDCAVDLVHHSRKTNGEDTTIEDARGASALIAASRSARALSRAGKNDARDVSDETRARLFRFTEARGNMTPPPATAAARWLRFVEVGAGNGSQSGDAADRTIGEDRIGVVTLFSAAQEEAETAMRSGSMTEEEKIREAVKAAVGDGQNRYDPQSKEWLGHAIGASLGIDVGDKDGKRRVRAVIADLLGRGILSRSMLPDRHREMRPSLILAENSSDQTSIFD